MDRFNYFTPQHWQQYQLIDSGNFEKLERFGDYVLRRPEPQAIWDRQLPEKEWNKAHATFQQQSSHAGTWQKSKNMPDQWHISYKGQGFQIKFKLALTAFKHVGIFPEQADNWEFLYRHLSNMKRQPKLLNLFAYTGGASLAAKAAKVDVVHVDSIKQVVSWSRENMELSRLQNIRWTVEDAMKFVKREVKRGHRYQGMVLDPPAYGIGTKGERWKLEDQLNELLKNVAQLMDERQNVFVINTYSLGLSALILENLMKQHFPFAQNLSCGELYLEARAGHQLPLGVLARFHS